MFGESKALDDTILCNQGTIKSNLKTTIILR